MQFQNGYLGGMILVLAIVVTVVASYALSLDMEEREVIKYEYVADLTGLFDSEQAPTYIEYNPSSNYTGYYTDPSTKYWDGVDATLTNKNNQYKVNLRPTAADSDAFDLTDLTSTDNLFGVMYWRIHSVAPISVTTKSISFSSLMTQLDYGSYDKVTIISDWSSWNEPETFFSFYTSSMVGTPLSGLSFKNPIIPNTSELTINILGSTIPASSVSDPIMAATYERSTGYVTLYYDRDMTVSLGLYYPDDVFVVFGGALLLWEFGSEGMVYGESYPESSYLDIRYGVKQNEN